jgi:hypothetical protein
MSCFSFYILSFVFCKKEAEQILPRREGWHQWEGEGAGKGGRKLNTMQQICIHACKCNNDTCCNYSMNPGRRG